MCFKTVFKTFWTNKVINEFVVKKNKNWELFKEVSKFHLKIFSEA